LLILYSFLLFSGLLRRFTPRNDVVVQMVTSLRLRGMKQEAIQKINKTMFAILN